VGAHPTRSTSAMSLQPITETSSRQQRPASSWVWVARQPWSIMSLLATKVETDTIEWSSSRATSNAAAVEEAGHDAMANAAELQFTDNRFNDEFKNQRPHRAPDLRTSHALANARRRKLNDCSRHTETGSVCQHCGVVDVHQRHR
jgi:hypothetical protein